MELIFYVKSLIMKKMVLNSVLRANKNIMGSKFGSIFAQYLLNKILTLFERVSLNNVESVERC